MRRGLVVVAVLSVVWLVGARTTEASHGMEGSSAAARQLAASVHRNLGCFACHGPAEHASPRAGASCAACHQREAAEFTRGPHGPATRPALAPTPTCVSCHGSHGVRRARDPQAPTSPGQTPLTCGRCHEKASRDFAGSVHASASTGRGGQPVSCAACHGAHDVAGLLAKSSPVSRQRVADTCGACHVQARLAFGRSLHARAVTRGLPHAPTCTDCHGGHIIGAVADPRSPVERLRVAEATCARCHGSLRITAMHDLPAAVVSDFRGSFHGLAGAAGDRRVASCASCHGHHEIRPSSSPYSRTHPANLGRTCGQCHPGAGPLFARGGVHHTERSPGHRFVGWLAGMYGGMIVVVIGSMALHNAIDFPRRLRDRFGRAPAARPPASPEILRFTLNERVQHWVLAASFVTLAATGFALRFGWRLPGIDGSLQETARAGTHRGAAVLFGGLALYHLGYLVLTRRGREMARAILPRFRTLGGIACGCVACLRLGPPSAADWRELIATVRYNLGLARERPAYGRFTYWEKMEYWALGWGAVIMAASGLVLWLETPFLNRFPAWAFELFRVVHFYEATLAVLAILVWHFYFTIANPDVFPLNRAMTRGTLTLEEMEREHALDLGRTHHVHALETDVCAECGSAHPGCACRGAGAGPGAGSPPAGGAAAHGEAGGGGRAPDADGGHQGS